mmetsp:Transcript_37711/g.56276  ORF Transcript_37711/g.56276 Transcript_37711/m.56276 type:complete len:220 (+) Transcript_37711:3-662(+)
MATSQEASELVRVSFGGRLLRTIGGVYEQAARAFFSSCKGNFSVESQVNSWTESARSVSVRMSAGWSMVQSAMAVKKMHDVAGAQQEEEAEAETEGGGDGQDPSSQERNAAKAAQEQEKKEKVAREAMASLEGSLPVFLQTIWDVSAIDIESTLSAVCDKVLKDVSVPWQIRHRRARALLRLARIFRDVGQIEHTDLSQASTAKQHLEEALYGAIKERG